jgi:hypothetical protein
MLFVVFGHFLAQQLVLEELGEFGSFFGVEVKHVGQNLLDLGAELP